MRIAIAACLAVLVAGCSAPRASTPAPSRTPVPTPTPPPAPEVQRVDILSNGVGAYMLVAIPVAILHNVASRTAATGVVVHFLVKRGGRTIFALDSPAVLLFPGETLVVTANCTDTCNNADAVVPTVAVSHWQAVGGAPVAADPGVYRCGAGCGGHGYGTVASTLHGSSQARNAPLHVFAACTTAAGAIVGGGLRQLTWPQDGGALAIDVPVILSGRPAACQVSASTPSSTAG